jgi:hypothetical protein
VVLDMLLERLAADGLVAAGGKMRTDSTHVVSAVRDLNRLELAGESVRACLEALAVAAPQVVAQLLDDSWGRRYSARIGTWRMPASETRKAGLALAYGRDGHTLLKAVHAAAATDPDLAFLAGLHQVEVLLADTLPRARAGAGYDRAAFAIDFDARQATCPQGHASSSWNPVTQRGTDTIVITFAKSTFGPCPVRAQCTTSAAGRRQLTVHPHDIHEAQLTARAARDTEDFQARYALRASVEGTIRQGIAVTAMRRARYRGLAKPAWNTPLLRLRST